MNRRKFIQSLGASVGASVGTSLGGYLGTSLRVGASLTSPFFLDRAWSQEAGSRPKLLTIKFDGGWDTSLSSDPWISEKRPQESDYFIEYLANELIPFQNSWVGPALRPLSPYMNRMTILNGILVNGSDNGHTASLTYMETGDGQGESAHFALEADHSLLKSPLGTAVDGQIYMGLESRKIINTLSLQNSRSIQLVPSVFEKMPGQVTTDLLESVNSLSRHQEKTRYFNQLLSASKAQGTELEIEVVAALFLSGLCHSASLSARDTDNMDSHSNHPGTHKASLLSGFESVHKWLSKLQQIESAPGSGKSLLDETTVLLYSEFSRTPALNNSKGKDHNPQTNSVIIISPRMKPQKIGAAKLIERKDSKIGIPYLVGSPLRQDEQVAQNRSEAVSFIRPETVLATLAEALGLDRSRLNHQIQNARVLRSVLKS